MNTLLFINANSYDVEIIKYICCMLVTVTAIIAVCSFLATVLKTLFDWMKSMEIGKKSKDQNGCNESDPEEEKRKFELQKQDRAKALVKDFYEATKGKEQKDLTVTNNLIELFEKIMGYGMNNSNNSTDGEEK